MIFYKIILILTIFRNLKVYSQITNFASSLKDIGIEFNSPCDINFYCRNPSLVCINNKCVCRIGFKL